MIIKFLSLLMTTLLFVGCSTLDVSVDYDDSFNFKGAKTFAIVKNNEMPEDTLTNDRIIDAIKNNLELKNYNQVAVEKADLIVVFYLKIKDKSQVHTSYSGAGYRGYGRGYGYGGGMMASTHTYEYEEGTLVIDALNPKTKKIVWRAIGVKELQNLNTPKERTEAVNAAVKKIMEKFPVK